MVILSSQQKNSFNNLNDNLRYHQFIFGFMSRSISKMKITSKKVIYITKEKPINDYKIGYPKKITMKI